MGILYKSMEVQNKLGSNNLVLVLKHESMEYMMKKHVWFEVELQGAQGDREDEVFQVSNDDTAVAQRRLEVKQPEEKTNTDCLVHTTMYEDWGRQTFGCCRVIAAEWRTRSPSSATGFKTPIDMLGFFGWLASIKQGMLEPVKVKCIFLGYRKRNLGFNESGEYKKTFIGSGVSTGSVQVLQGVKFEVEPQEDHTFEVEPHRNVDQELFSYKEDSSEAAFAVAAVEKIYAHESLTFNNTVACEVISKWKAGLKDDMDARSDMYVLSNCCKKCSDDSDVYYWEYTPSFTTETWYKTLLEGHSILSLEGILSRDCDVEKNGKWSCIYAVGSQEYQMVCTRLDIASADVGMLDKFDRGLQTNVQVLWILTTSWVDQSQVGYMTLTEAAKEAIWLKGLTIESGFELKIVAGIATGALSKAVPRSRFQHRFKLLRIEDF
ncbi:hypothetical protein Tco_1091478 [Tanacetum coccineum]|uniref:Zinc finger, CCHC-type n=1 Tax=Tanacetum coccineum TaxID=301880 RepID=A0ABQ5I758_9ASTR